jgi:hypothetical protein
MTRPLATHSVKNHPLFIELEQSMSSYCQKSFDVEQSQINYLYRYTFKNTLTDEKFSLNHSFEKSHHSYVKSIQQKVFNLEAHARELEYVPVFLTLTLPSKFHPFISRKNRQGEKVFVSVNQDFGYGSLDEAIKQGYTFLKSAMRVLYKRMKAITKNQMLFVKVYEPHGSSIPHLHCVLFVKKDYISNIKRCFERFVSEYELSCVSFETLFNDNVHRATSYLMKYLLKGLNQGEGSYYARYLDGWKRTHKIRVITMSSTLLPLQLYRRIYHTIPSKVKELIDKTIKTENISIYSYIEKSFSFVKIVNNEIAKVLQGTSKPLFECIHTVKTELNERRSSGVSTQTMDFTISYQNELIARKIERINNY